MKKNLLIIGLLALTITACNNQVNTSSNGEPDISTLSIISPTGAPALAFYDFAKGDNFITNNDPTNIVAMMNTGQKDIIVLPTNAGVGNINKGAPYKLAATITFGNFYVASLNNDDNGVMDENDVILLFQQNNVPDKLFHYVYGNDLDNAIHYVGAVNDVAVAVRDQEFEDNKVKYTPNYVLTAEPSLTSLIAQYGVTKYADIQTEYRKKSNNSEMFQASVFIKNDVGEDKGNAFLNKLKADIEAALSDSNKLLEGMNKVEGAQELFGVPPQVATNVLKANNGMGLGFKMAKENKAAIDKFLSIFNIPETNEKIYF